MQRIAILGERRQAAPTSCASASTSRLPLSLGAFRAANRLPCPQASTSTSARPWAGRVQAAWPRRLLRHATRSAGRPPQPLRPELLAALVEANLLAPSARLPASKTLHWHVDYLLDKSAATLAGVIALPSPVRHETALAQLVADDRHTIAPASGLGASDAPGATHLQRIALQEALSPEQWWESLLLRLVKQFTTSAAALRIDDTRRLS